MYNNIVCPKCKDRSNVVVTVSLYTVAHSNEVPCDIGEPGEVFCWNCGKSYNVRDGVIIEDGSYDIYVMRVDGVCDRLTIDPKESKEGVIGMKKKKAQEPAE